MRVVKKLILALLLIVLALGIGGAIYMVQYMYFTDTETVEEVITPTPTEIVTPAPTEEPDLSQYVITIDTVNIRKEPTTESDVIEKVGKDTVLQLLYGDSEWSSVIYKGENAYVNNEFIEPYDNGSSGYSDKIIVIDAGCQSSSDTETEPVGPESVIMKNKSESGFKGVATGKFEYELNLELALLLKSALESKGYQVVMTRDSNDVNVSNASRAEIANTSSASVFISLRANASVDENMEGVVGVCPTINNPYNSAVYNNSYKLANALSNEVSIATGAVNGGIWQTDTLSIINWSDVPVTVLQVGYLSNRNEEQNLINKDYQQRIVDGILKGLDAYFGQ